MLKGKITLISIFLIISTIIFSWYAFFGDSDFRFRIFDLYENLLQSYICYAQNDSGTHSVSGISEFMDDFVVRYELAESIWLIPFLAELILLIMLYSWLNKRKKQGLEPGYNNVVFITCFTAFIFVTVIKFFY